MTAQTQSKKYSVHLKRTFAARREKVFKAWTEPIELKKWWGVADDWSTPITEVDLRVGGKYRLGMQPPEKDAPYIVGGTYREVQPPERLVYTWCWEGGEMEETLVTVLFHDSGDSTEVELGHEYLPDEKTRDDHKDGWEGCLSRLAKIL
ncbi:MAG: SRPBCC domain-containing protein [bacterium]